MKFSCNIRIQQDLLSQANFYCDIKQNFNAIWSKIYLKRIFRSEANFIAIWCRFFCDKKQIFLRCEANFIVIWSNIRYLKRMFLSEANLYCDMKPFLCDLKRIPLFEGKFSIWSKFIVWYEANCSRNLKRNPLSEMIFFILQQICIDMKRFLLQYEADFYCDMKIICTLWYEAKSAI